MQDDDIGGDKSASASRECRRDAEALMVRAIQLLDMSGHDAAAEGVQSALETLHAMGSKGTGGEIDGDRAA